jgi:hypothetical protein
MNLFGQPLSKHRGCPKLQLSNGLFKSPMLSKYEPQYALTMIDIGFVECDNNVGNDLVVSDVTLEVTYFSCLRIVKANRIE